MTKKAVELIEDTERLCKENEQLRKRVADLEWAVEYTLKFAEGMQTATPEQIKEWLEKAKKALKQ